MNAQWNKACLLFQHKMFNEIKVLWLGIKSHEKKNISWNIVHLLCFFSWHNPEQHCSGDLSQEIVSSRRKVPDQCPLPGVPPHPGRLHHLLRHAADGDPLEADHRVARREHHVQGPHDVQDRRLHSLLPDTRGHQHWQVGDDEWTFYVILSNFLNFQFFWFTSRLFWSLRFFEFSGSYLTVNHHLSDLHLSTRTELGIRSTTWT